MPLVHWIVGPRRAASLPPPTPALVAYWRARLIVRRDREAVPCARWVKLPRPRGYTRVVNGMCFGPIYYGGKPAYRWQVRR